MKKGLINNNISVISSIVVIFTMMINLINGIIVPSMMYMLLACVMLGLICLSKEEFNKGRMNKEQWLIIFFAGLMVVMSEVSLSILRITDVI